MLPESVGTLYNLQVLSLRGCKFLCKLPLTIGNVKNLQHLDIFDTEQLQEMPSGIHKLTNLQTLTKIAVTKNGGLGLQDLRDLSYLSGNLSITGLQNVLEIHDAKEANLKHKQLDGLMMEWCSNFEDRQNEELEMHLLEELRPHGCLKSLEIKFYSGTKFPSWLGDQSFTDLTKLRLEDCRKCGCLPTLGHLRLLKELVIQGMHGVKRIGEEFFKLNDCPSLELPFPKLETLEFNDMPEWEEWFSSGDVMQFSCLRKLRIWRSPKLNKVSTLRLPTLCVLSLDDCGEIVIKSVTDHTNSLTELSVKSITDLTCLWPSGVQLENLVNRDVLRCPKLLSLCGEEEKGLLKSLEVLKIEDCDNLEKLPNVFSKLRRLEITRCKALESLPGDISHLEEIKIIGCPNFKDFWSPSTNAETGEEEKSLLKNLEVLEIEDCDNLEKLPNVFSKLRRLYMTRCKTLKSLPKDISHLEELLITACYNLKEGWSSATTTPTETGGNHLPIALKSFFIEFYWDDADMTGMMLQRSTASLEIFHIRASDWPNMGSGQSNFGNLVRLYIWECEGIESLTVETMGFSTPNLRYLYIYSCWNLTSLWDQNYSLTSLQSLKIQSCKVLYSFPQVDLPPNLRELEIERCEGLKPLTEWGLHRLASLQKFEITGGYPEMVSFPLIILPPTLTRLKIGYLEKVESLASLSHQNLPSLQHLYISNCPKLRSLPKEDLLLQLLSLTTINCPIVKERCIKDKGDYWPLIAHIPFLYL